jgi:hypothetical protein
MILARCTPGPSARGGMTLVEMLVSTAVTLILVGLVAQLFGILGNSVTASRSLIETTDQLRSAAFRLRTDLTGMTVEPLPPVRPESDSGYLEIIEGPTTDLSAAPSGILGDYDDVLMFTTRSPGQPFVGRFAGTQSIESMTSEVAWFCQRATTQPISGLTVYNLYRKQLLVTGFVGSGAFVSGANSITGVGIPAVYSSYDLSLRPEGSALFPNSLGELCKRENRFLHVLTSGSAGSFPFPCLIGPTASGVVFDSSSGRQGEDLILTNVIAFDIRVYDPEAAIRSSGTEVLVPGDAGYAAASAISPVPKGAYVDLGANGGTSLGAAMATASRLTGAATYDTWSTHYEFNGLDENADGFIDGGADGQDNNGNGLVDEAAERDTAPPYSVALRGLEVRIRLYEPSSRQVRQVTVRHTFVPH